MHIMTLCKKTGDSIRAEEPPPIPLLDVRLAAASNSSSWGETRPKQGRE